MHRLLLSPSVRLITDSFCRCKSFEKGRRNVFERLEFSRTFVDSQDLGVSDIGAKSVTGVLQSQIVNALHLGERDKALSILSTLNCRNDPLRTDDFVCILDYCARSPDPLFVMETWRIMEEKEIGMNSRCYMLIIQALTKGGYLEEAFNWLSYLGGIPHSRPDLPMYNIFLSGCIRMRSMGHIDSCLELMENQMVGKSEDTYWELLKVCTIHWAIVLLIMT
ncbi:Tetratricopeptide repeat (TPR)-like superfamily protein [Thalictrum thalictroides]|uniref:Tetratricopeptide repeat (TPR)-like superfamily protein n=1 Tax=Thalictrum thalictroides TaxID=46969 RepID=A0A7J6WT17_THATH|nr:Tetratricopeptide repeat (TPR)-like superfamily protein [Thalictrum thalictroides]